MGTAVRPANTSSGPWDAFADVAVFVDEVVGDAGLPELERMNSTTTTTIIIIPRTCVITPKAVSNGWARIGALVIAVATTALHATQMARSRPAAALLTDRF